MTSDRRMFLKLAAAAAVAAGGGFAPALGASSRGRPDGALRWAKAPCRFCGVGCGVQVGVQGGRIAAVIGDTESPVNKGLLCVKGYQSAMAPYGADRLTTPLQRRGDRFEAISWEVAIRAIANRIAIDPKGMAFYGSGQWTLSEAYAAQKFMKAGLGSNHLDASARFSEGAEAAGARATYGDDAALGCYDDLDVAEVVILWGSNPAEEHPVLFSRLIDRRIAGQTVTVLDIAARRTRSTAAAQSYFRCLPNTQGVVARGLLALLVADEHLDRAFVEAHCTFRLPSDPPTEEGRAVSFEEWKAALAEWTPERVQQISEVRPADLRMIAQLFGKRDARIVSLWSEGVNDQADAVEINSLIQALHLLSGHVGRPGDGALGLSAQPSARGSAREVGTFADALPGGLRIDVERDRTDAEGIWNLPAGRIDPTPGHDAVAMWAKFSQLDGSGGGVHTLWVQGSNPAQTLPHGRSLFDPSRKDKDKFLIVSDVYPTPTTLAADLVLPSAMWVEKAGMYGSVERRTQHWTKMIDPPGDAREDAWQVIAVARELFARGLPGMKDKDGKFLFDLGGGQPIWTWPGYQQAGVDRLLFEEYRRFAALRQRNLAPYDAYVGARGLRWPVVEAADGSVRETPRRYVEGSDAAVAAGAGVEFYRAGDKRARIWFHPLVKSAPLTDAEFPLFLMSGPVLEHEGSGAMTGRIPPLRDAMPQAFLEMSRQDASKMGIRNGETVVVESRTGSARIPVWIEGRGAPRPGVVFMPGFDERMRVSDLAADVLDPKDTTASVSACAVRVRRLVK